MWIFLLVVFLLKYKIFFFRFFSRRILVSALVGSGSLSNFVWLLAQQNAGSKEKSRLFPCKIFWPFSWRRKPSVVSSSIRPWQFSSCGGDYVFCRPRAKPFLIISDSYRSHAACPSKQSGSTRILGADHDWLFKKSCPFIYSKSLYNNGQVFWK